jgi:hypothetical protein
MARGNFSRNAGRDGSNRQPYLTDISLALPVHRLHPDTAKRARRQHLRTLFKSLLALVALFSGSVAVAVEPKPLLFGGARAGATLEEVSRLVQLAKPPVGKKPYIRGATCELVRTDYSISGMEMQQCYFFKDNRLVMVRFHANVTEMAKQDKSLSVTKRTLLANGYFNESVKHLTEKYGRATRVEGNPSTAYYRWERDNGLVIELSTVRAFALSTSVWFSDGSLPSASLVKKQKQK